MKNWAIRLGLTIGILFGLGIPATHGQYFEVEVFEWAQPHNFPGVHSGAFAQWQGKWIFLGGRTNGLHGFLPPLAFPTSGILHDIWVYDPVQRTMQTATLNNLPTSIFESVTSSNLEHYQIDSMLYLVGGYGWCDTASAFRTFPTLTALNLNHVLDSVGAGNGVTSLFRQITDQRMAVTGGNLQRIGDTFYLVFGHRFDGMYDRVDSTGFFVQHYTHQIRKFEIYDDGDSLAIDNYTAITDSPAFHRRDFNLAPHILPNGAKGLIAFSGVFQPGTEQPWYYPIRIDSAGYSLDTSFSQQFSHYQCGLLPIALNSQTSYQFFGGMAEYFFDTLQTPGQVARDTLVPFVNTMPEVVCGYVNNQFVWNEWLKSGSTLPALLGTNMYFIPDLSQNWLYGEVWDFPMVGSSHHVGWLAGGIESPEPNLANTDPSISFASPRIFDVWVRSAIISNSDANPLGNLQLGPNPFQDRFSIQGREIPEGNYQLELWSTDGRKLREWQREGGKTMEWNLEVPGLANGVYLLNVEGKGYLSTSFKLLKQAF